MLVYTGNLCSTLLHDPSHKILENPKIAISNELYVVFSYSFLQEAAEIERRQSVMKNASWIIVIIVLIKKLF